jgi:hypothetical protein
MKCLFLLFVLMSLYGSLEAYGQGMTVGRDVPVPEKFDVRVATNGQPYVVIRKFKRRKTGVILSPVRVGAVQPVWRGNGGVQVTLKPSQGPVLQVRTGHAFSVGSRSFLAMGFRDDQYLVRCSQSGRLYAFGR